MNKPLVTIEELSMLIDAQLDDALRTDITARLEKCPLSQKLYASMTELTQSLAKGIIEKAAIETDDTCANCPDDETLMLLQENHLSPAQTLEIEQHLTECKSCLKRLMTEVRSAVSMNNADWKELPEQVHNDPRLGGLAKRAKPKEKNKLVNTQPETADDETVFSLEYELGSKLSQTFELANNSIHISLTAQGNTAANIELTLYKDRAYLKNSEVVVWDNKSKRKIFRGLSNSEGKIAVRRLHANTYDLHSQELNAVVKITIQ